MIIEIEKGEAGYPASLLSWSGAPARLYCSGDASLLSGSCVAIVGTREPSATARSTAYHLAYQLASTGLIIVSGLARGIDGQAHRAALAAHGKTIAVLGTPLSQVYPPEHAQLAEEIAAHGLLVSLWAEQARSRGEAIGRFIRRDALQAALSQAIIPIQAGRQSGTRHAIEWASKHGRLLAVTRPDPRDQEQSPERYGLIDDLMARPGTIILESGDCTPLLARIEEKPQQQSLW